MSDHRIQPIGLGTGSLDLCGGSRALQRLRIRVPVRLGSEAGVLRSGRVADCRLRGITGRH
jgi:hypothetical protein